MERTEQTCTLCAQHFPVDFIHRCQVQILKDRYRKVADAPSPTAISYAKKVRLCASLLYKLAVAGMPGARIRMEAMAELCKFADLVIAEDKVRRRERYGKRA